MTKQDFELIANVIARLPERAGEVAAWKVAQSFAEELKLIYPRFDYARFMKACGFDLKETSKWL
jgi:hypothetical protein